MMLVQLTLVRFMEVSPSTLEGGPARRHSQRIPCIAQILVQTLSINELGTHSTGHVVIGVSDMRWVFQSAGTKICALLKYDICLSLVSLVLGDLGSTPFFPTKHHMSSCIHRVYYIMPLATRINLLALSQNMCRTHNQVFWLLPMPLHCGKWPSESFMHKMMQNVSTFPLQTHTHTYINSQLQSA